MIVGEVVVAGTQATGHMVLAIRKQGGMNAGTQLAFFSLFSLEPQPINHWCPLLG